MPRSRVVAGLFLVGVALAACDGRRGLERDGSLIVDERPDGTRVAVRAGRDPNAAYVQATELKAKGDCPTAIALLRPVAMLGPGYENAQTALGECLLAQGEHTDGEIWLTRAADAGWPEAQAALGAHLAAGAPARNPDDAAYWLALYELNANKARVGFRAPDAKLLSGARAALSEEHMAAGRKRAASWQRKLWIPPAEAEGPGLKPAQRAPAGLRPSPR
ncbi:MAG: hypothetical protein AB7E79_04990 [Rhodospirillaceae bacterium]